MNESTLLNKKITVTVHTKKNEREQVQDSFSNLFVSNLPFDLEDAEFKKLFEPFGEIVSWKLIKEKGQGFVKFKTHAEAQKAIDELNLKKQFNGNAIFVQKHISQNQSQGTTMIQAQIKKNYESNIFVQFIPKDVTENEFKDQMSKAGNVLSVKLKDQVQTNRMTGEKFVNFQSGFVCYEDVKQAQKCI